MKQVSLLWHAYELDGQEESKFLGVYSSNEAAQEAIRYYRTVKGFKHFPNDFMVLKHNVDERMWKQGFSMKIGGEDLFSEN